MSDDPDAQEWTALGVVGPALEHSSGRFRTESGTGFRLSVQCVTQMPFRGVYLIVTSPGWFIHQGRAGNEMFIYEVDGDAYSRDAHDRLERIGQLERHRLNFSLQVGNMLSFIVTPRCLPSVCGEREAVVSALADHGCPHPRLPFSAVVIGVRL